MMGVFNYCMYNHEATDQNTYQDNEHAAEEEVQIDKEMLQVLQDVKDIFEEPMFLHQRHQLLKLLNCQHDYYDFAEPCLFVSLIVSFHFDSTNFMSRYLSRYFENSLDTF